MSPAIGRAAEARGALGVYVHVPFCASICAYCNFNRGLLDEALKRRYVDALVSSAATAADGSAVDTIYFGGGTPSLLQPSEIARLIAACRDAFSVDPDAEITLEANPETVDEARLAGFREAGVTRLSLGVQSFRDGELARLGRLHSAARAVGAIRAARHAGFADLSVDLMMWLPQQTRQDWMISVHALIDAAPDHASLYLLEVYPNAPLRDAMARSAWTQASEDEAADMYLEAMATLEAAGLRQYEIANVAREGHRCRHNLKYWQDGEWLAFGCGAHGTRDGVRWRNVASATEFVARIEAGSDVRAEQRALSPDEAAGEAMMMGLRLTDGVEIDRVLSRYGVDVAGRYRDAVRPAVEAGLLDTSQGVWRLTRPGMLLSSEILRVFV